jgi:undecaprenyl-diphosphatase
MSSGLVTLELITEADYIDWQALLWGILLSFIAAYGCIQLFLRHIERIGMLPFVIYRLLLAGLILFLTMG